jgi:hypothetical protein
VRATGTTGSFLYERSYAASAPTVTLTLTCTPTDSRISAAQATKSVSLRVE